MSTTVTVTTLTIDADDGVTTTVHANDEGAWDALREHLTYHDGEDAVPPVTDPQALLDYACGEGGLSLWIDTHIVTLEA